MILDTIMESETKPKKTLKPRVIKADLKTKTGKYFINRTKGMNKIESAKAAGYLTPNTTEIEETKMYAAIHEKYANKLLDKISLEQIASAHSENILQDEDKGARNTAIKMALDKIEPENMPTGDDDKVLVIMRRSAL